MSYAVCPHCGSGENLATVGSVITYGTHVTNTEAVTIGMFGGEGMYRTWSTSAHAGLEQFDLAAADNRRAVADNVTLNAN